jgi:putative peptidoglycan lipid II flippase
MAATKLMGLLREILVAKYFGVSGQVDAFIAALALPALVGAGVGSAIASALLPRYRLLLTAKDTRDANRLAGAAVSFAVLLSLVLAIPLLLIPGSIVHVVVPSLPGPTALLAAKFLRWLSLLVLSLSLLYILSAIYNALHNFTIPAISELVAAPCAIFALVLFGPRWGLYALAWGMVVGSGLGSALQLFLLWRKRIVNVTTNFRGTGLSGLLIASFPVFLSDLCMQGASLMQIFFASGVSVGGVAALAYAEKLETTAVTFVAVNFAKGIFPTFATLGAEEKRLELRDLFATIGKQLMMILVPLTFVFVFLRREIISLVFMRGVFDEKGMEITAYAFLFFSLGLLPGAWTPLFSRACYALLDTITPLRGVIVGACCRILLIFLLTPRMGIGGIALSVALARVPPLFLMGRVLWNRLHGLPLRDMAKTVLLCCLCSTVALLVFGLPRTLSLFGVVLSVLLYFALYFVGAWFLLTGELKTMGRLLLGALRMSGLSKLYSDTPNRVNQV